MQDEPTLFFNICSQLLTQLHYIQILYYRLLLVEIIRNWLIQLLEMVAIMLFYISSFRNLICLQLRWLLGFCYWFEHRVSVRCFVVPFVVEDFFIYQGHVVIVAVTLWLFKRLLYLRQFIIW